MTKLIDQLYIKPKQDKGLNKPKFQQIKQGDTLQVDLLFMPLDRGYKYILTVVDIGTPRVTDAEPLKTKDSNEVKNAFIKILQRKIIKTPKQITMDSGTEFSESQRYFENQDIFVKRAKPGRHRQLGMVERRNQMIAKDLFKRMTEQEILTGQTSNQWIDDLPKLIKKINNKDAKKKYKKPEDEYQCEGDACFLLNKGDKVRVALDYPIDVVTGKKLHGPFRATDIRWTKEPRTIMEVLINVNNPPMYLLDDPKQPDGIDTSAAYTKTQLLPVKDNEQLPTKESIRPIIDDDGVEKYVVEKILKKKKIKGKTMYEVKWVGYDETTFETEKNLKEDVPEMIKEFEKINSK